MHIRPSSLKFTFDISIENDRTLSFKKLTLNDLTEIENKISNISDASAFTINLIDSKLASSEYSRSIRNFGISDRNLVIRLYAKEQFNANISHSNENDIYSEFVMAASEYITSKIKRLNAIANYSKESTYLTEILKPINILPQKFFNTHSYLMERMTSQQKDWIQSISTPQMDFIKRIANASDQNAISNIVKSNEALARTMKLISGIDVIRTRMQGFVALNKDFSSLVNIPRLDFLKNLPDLNRIQKSLEEIKAGSNALNDAGFSLSLDLWNIQFIKSLPTNDLKKQRIGIANRMIALSKDELFWINILRPTLQSSEEGRQRIKVIEEAFYCHRERKYAVSIPTLIIQFEGLFTESMIKVKLIQSTKKGTVPIESGKLKKDRRGRTIILNGLQSKVDHAKTKPSVELVHFIEFLENEIINTDTKRGFIKTRNLILHGSITNYGRPKLSAQLLFAIYAVAAELGELTIEDT